MHLWDELCGDLLTNNFRI